MRGFRNAGLFSAAMAMLGMEGSIGKALGNKNVGLSELERNLMKKYAAQKIRGKATFSYADKKILASMPAGRAKRQKVKELKREYGVL